MLDAVHDLVPVLDVAVEVLDPGVEDVGQAVLAEVFDREDAVRLRKLVLFVHPQRPKVLDRVHFLAGLRQVSHELFKVKAEVVQHVPHVTLVFAQKVDNGFTIIF